MRAVQFLLGEATGLPWKQNDLRNEFSHGTQEPWEGQQVLIFDENYAVRDPSSGYVCKNLEQVWLSRLDAACCGSLSLYITCSEDCINRGVLAVHHLLCGASHEYRTVGVQRCLKVHSETWALHKLPQTNSTRKTISKV